LEKPIIIWTLRRTGGTSLANLLFTSSKFKAIQHEPFNEERVWGDVSTDVTNQLSKPRNKIIEYDLDHLRERIAIYCNLKRNIKHSMDNTPFLVTKYLLEASQEVGYKHIVLFRKNQFRRILSLIIAQRTTWKLGYSPNEAVYKVINGEIEIGAIPFEEIAQVFDSSIKVVGRLYEEFHQNDIDYYRVYFEELYSNQFDEKGRIKNMMKILDYLNIEAYDTSLLERSMFKSSENTHSVYNHIPDYAQLEALAEFHGIT
jgi:hypothetical protein